MGLRIENCKLEFANWNARRSTAPGVRRSAWAICNSQFAIVIFQFSLTSFFMGLHARAADAPDPEKSADKLLTPAARRGVDHGLRWLAGRQNADGSFGQGAMRGNAAICGLCGMAFLAGGSTPGRGTYGDRVQRAVDYLLANAQPSGFICESPPNSQGPMYSHGFATLFLAECYGMSPRRELREKLAAAVKLIVDHQNREGGWRYEPKIVEYADISVTVCQVMALRAAYNAGIYVSKEKFKKAVGFVLNLQNNDGGFGYMLSMNRESKFPRSAAAIVALNSAGIYQQHGKQAEESRKDPEYQHKQEAIQKGLEYLNQFRPKKDVVQRDTEYFEYGHYYAAQAMWQAGGERWALWYPAVRDDLLSRQLASGSWARAPTAPNTPPPCAFWFCKCRKTNCRSSSGERAMTNSSNTRICAFVALRLCVRTLACVYANCSRRKGAKTQRRKEKAGRSTGAFGLFCTLALLTSFDTCLKCVAMAESPLAVPVDGEPFQGKLISIDLRGKLVFSLDGKTRVLAAEDLIAWGHPAELRKGPIVVLADGGRLAAAVTGADKTRLSVVSSWLGPLNLPLDSLAGIIFRAPPGRKSSTPCWIALPLVAAESIGCCWTTETKLPG